MCASAHICRIAPPTPRQQRRQLSGGVSRRGTRLRKRVPRAWKRRNGGKMQAGTGWLGSTRCAGGPGGSRKTAAHGPMPASAACDASLSLAPLRTHRTSSPGSSLEVGVRSESLPQVFAPAAPTPARPGACALAPASPLRQRSCGTRDRVCYPPVSTLASALRSLSALALALHPTRGWHRPLPAAIRPGPRLLALRAISFAPHANVCPCPSLCLSPVPRPALWSPPLPVSSSTLRKANLNPVSSPIVLPVRIAPRCTYKSMYALFYAMLLCMTSLRTSVYMRDEVSPFHARPTSFCEPSRCPSRPCTLPNPEPSLARTSALHADGPAVRRSLQLRRRRVALTS